MKSIIPSLASSRSRGPRETEIAALERLTEWEAFKARWNLSAPAAPKR